MNPSAPGPSRATARWVAAATAAAVVGVDQASKSWALAALADGPIDLFWTLRLRLTFNSGAAFSLGTGFPWLFVALGVVMLTGMAVVVVRAELPRWPTVALGLVAGGALGNLVDRLLRSHDGAVVDFIDLQWWPVFNVADAAISVGVLLLILTWRDADPGKDPEPAVAEKAA